MSLNCMNCHLLQRTNSDREMRTRFIDKSEKHRYDDSCKVHATLRCKVLADRSWSGNLMPPPYNKMDESNEYGSPKKKAKKVHRRYGSTGAVPTIPEDDLCNEPKLVRSGGIRRDWSFEDLAAEKRDGKRKERT